MKTSLVRAAHFSCGYAYRMPSKSDEENRLAYGKLAEGDGFGRNFRFEISLTGQIDPLSGMIVNLADIDTWIKKIVATLDHRFLNTDVEYFKTHVPTPENIVRYIFLEIQKQISDPNIQLTNVRLFESDTRWLDFKS